MTAADAAAAEPVPDIAALTEALEASWPAASVARLGPFLLRDGGGGGSRVSAATAEAPATETEIAAAEAAMRAAGREPLFRLRPALCPWDAALDAALAARGHALTDPTLFYVAPVARLAPDPLPRLKAFAIWPPLAIQRDLWAEAGIGAARLAVMARVAGPKAAIMAREADRVAGTAFVAARGPLAMLHAMEVTPGLRRRGAARSLLRGAAEWAAAQGVSWLALAVTAANAPARALYEAAGMHTAGGYHYRRAAETPEVTR